MSDNSNDFKITQKDNFYYLSGSLNELSALKDVKLKGDPIKLNLEGINFINSLGTREWVKFCTNHQNAHLEFHRVSRIMMNAIAMMPLLIPAGGKATDLIKSFALPYCCLNCSHITIKFVELTSLTFEDESVYSKLTMCQLCGNPANRAEEGSEYIALLSDEVNVDNEEEEAS